MANTDDQEDFSFPTITDTPLRFIDSPPLWHRCSSVAREKPAPKGDDQGREFFQAANSIKNKQRRSFSYVERGVVMAEKEDDSEDEEEEKMDMLWEDLNEELYSKTHGSGLEYSDASSPGGVADFGRVKLSTTSGTVFSGKKPSVVVFMKVLKKLFLLHNSQRSVKKRTW